MKNYALNKHVVVELELNSFTDAHTLKWRPDPLRGEDLVLPRSVFDVVAKRKPPFAGSQAKVVSPKQSYY